LALPLIIIKLKIIFTEIEGLPELPSNFLRVFFISFLKIILGLEFSPETPLILKEEEV